ncbi:MAG: zinc-binding alcohol dehydrogenase [Chloroflexota bacterium]|nr:zinc-binding alcohol dehydrogenase [Chloroflexota bacterium]
MRGKELVFPEPFRAEWQDVPVGEPGPGQVLIHTRKTLISTGTELTAYTGDFPADSGWSRYISYPWRLAGYSNVGNIVALGPDVQDLAIGDRVANWGHHAEYNIQSLAGRYSGVQIVPEDVSDDQAAFWQLGKTVMNGVRLARIALGEAVVTVGAGILGQLAIQYIHLSGAFPLIAVDLSERRLELAADSGATYTLPGDRQDLIDELRRITHGRMADVVFEITGNQQVIPIALRMARPQGRIIILGSPRGPVEIDFHNEVHSLGLQVIGAHVSTHPDTATPCNPWTAQRNGELFFDLVQAGRLQVDGLISHRFSWQEAPSAYTMLAEDRTQAMGVVLEGWQD